MIKGFLPDGDNGIIDDSHWNLNEFGELIDHIEKMPKLDTTIKHTSQYIETKYQQGCSIMSSINALQTIKNIQFTPEEISSIYDKAVEAGYEYGKGWSRYYGVNVVRDWWNNRHPDDQFYSFVVQLFSDEFNMVMDKLGIAVVGINVDSTYWKDVRDNLILEKDGPFALALGHATTMMYNNKYFCVDSVPRDKAKDKNTPMVYTRGNKMKLDFLVGFKNLRKDCHIFLFENRLKVMDEEERTRLTTMKGLLEEAIKVNGELWNLTTQEEERKVRKNMNDYNRNKLKIIDSMLK